MSTTKQPKMYRFEVLAGKHWPAPKKGQSLRGRKPLVKGSRFWSEKRMDLIFPNSFQLLTHDVEKEEYVTHPILGVMTKTQYDALPEETKSFVPPQVTSDSKKDAKEDSPTPKDEDDEEGEGVSEGGSESSFEDVTDSFSKVPEGLRVLKTSKGFDVVDEDGEKVNEDSIAKKSDVSKFLKKQQ